MASSSVPLENETATGVEEEVEDDILDPLAACLGRQVRNVERCGSVVAVVVADCALQASRAMQVVVVRESLRACIRYGGLKAGDEVVGDDGPC